jgi:hypothetical protein
MGRTLSNPAGKFLHLTETEAAWKNLLKRLEKDFGGELDLQGVLFLVGVQELGQGNRKYNKDQKLEVFHIAICTLLEPYGYYEFLGNDEQGYPHWKQSENLPPLNPGQQLLLMKQSLISYFGDIYGEIDH